MRAAALTGSAPRSNALASNALACLATLLCLPSNPAALADGDLDIPRQVAIQQESSPAKPSKKDAAKSADKSPRKQAAKPQRMLIDATKPDGASAEASSKDKEVAVEKFVDQHHPELGILLNHLKENNRQEYERAVRDLSRVADRLALTRDRDERRYQLELKQWQNQSRIDLLTARLKMANSEDYREPMRVLLRERLDLKAALLQLDRERLVERIQKTDQQLQTLSAEPSVIVESQLRVILGANKPARPVKPAGAAKKNSSK